MQETKFEAVYKTFTCKECVYKRNDPVTLSYCRYMLKGKKTKKMCPWDLSKAKFNKG